MGYSCIQSAVIIRIKVLWDSYIFSQVVVVVVLNRKSTEKRKMSSENNEYKPRNTYQQDVCEERALMELGG